MGDTEGRLKRNLKMKNAFVLFRYDP